MKTISSLYLLAGAFIFLLSLNALSSSNNVNSLINQNNDQYTNKVNKSTNLNNKNITLTQPKDEAPKEGDLEEVVDSFTKQGKKVKVISGSGAPDAN